MRQLILLLAVCLTLGSGFAFPPERVAAQEVSHHGIFRNNTYRDGLQRIVVRQELRRLARTAEPNEAAMYRAVLRSSEMFDMFYYSIMDRYHSNVEVNEGTPIKDAIARLIDYFRENPGSFKELVEWLIGLFGPSVVGFDYVPVPQVETQSNQQGGEVEAAIRQLQKDR